MPRIMVVALFGRHFAGRCDIFGARPGRDPAAPGRPAPAIPAPGRPRARPPMPLRAGFATSRRPPLAVPSCSAARPSEIARLDNRSDPANGAIESFFGFGGDDAAGAPVSASPRSVSRRGCAQEAQRIAPRLHRIVVAAKPHIDRPDHLPAAAILGILLQMRLDPAEQLGDRALLRANFTPSRAPRLDPYDRASPT